MKWDRIAYEERDDFYWRADMGAFSADVSHAPWISAEKPWVAEVYMGLGHTRLSHSATANEAKVKVRRHVFAFARRLNTWGSA